MQIAIRRLQAPVHFLLSNIGCAVFQLFVLMIAALGEGFLVLFFGHFFWTIDETHVVASYIFLITVFVVLLAGGYAAVWSLFWWIIDGAVGKIKWFYWKVAFSTLPFVPILFLFNPHPDPMAMIPASHAELQFVFSCLVTGFVVYPVFSILLYKQSIRRNRHKLAGLVITCAVAVPIVTVIFITAWNLMDPIYHLTA